MHSGTKRPVSHEHDHTARSVFTPSVLVQKVGRSEGGGKRRERLGPVFPGEAQDTTPAISVSSARREKRRSRRGGAGG